VARPGDAVMLVGAWADGVEDVHVAGLVSQLGSALGGTRTPAVLSVASGRAVDEGRWGRSEGQIGSMRVRCKSVWLLHLAAALPVRLVLAA
jgi:hypothetical protein